MKVKNILWIVCLFLGIQFTSCTDDDIVVNEYEIYPDSEGVVFKDVNLKSSIYKLLEKDLDENLTFEEVKGITNLNLRSRGIKSIEGIQYFVNVDTLNLALNFITDFSLVDSLKRLPEGLYIEDYDDEHIPVFEDNLIEMELRQSLMMQEPAIYVPEDEPLTYGLLKKLENIFVTDNPRYGKVATGDLSGLEYCINATTMKLSFGAFSPEEKYREIDLSTIENLVNIKEVGIAGIDFTRGNPQKSLGKLINTESISLISCLLNDLNDEVTADLSDLSSLVNVKHLSFWKTGLGGVDTSPFSAMTKLEILSFISTVLFDENGDLINEDISFVSSMPNLKSAAIRFSGVQDVSPLKNCTDLETITFFNVNIDESTLVTLNSMPNLTRLGFEAIDISDDGFASFFTGANLPKLYSLNLNSNKSLTDISAITKANLPTMADKSLVPDGEESKLFLSNTGVTSLSPLSGLKSFDSMMVGETQINSFEGLENMNLTKLIANNCKVADLTPLTGMTNLSELNVSYTLVGQLDPLFNLENLRQLSVSRSKVTFMEIQEFKSHNPNCVVANI